MKTYYPPHRVTMRDKLRDLTEAFRRGDTVQPVVVQPDGLYAVTGSHRIAAAEAAGVECPAVVMTEQEWDVMWDFLKSERGYDETMTPDHGDIAMALWRTATRPEMRAALENQW